MISRDMLWTEMNGESRLTFVRAPKHYIRVRSRELRVLLQVLGKKGVSVQFRVTRAWGDSRIRGYLVVGVEGRRMHLLENIESHAMQGDPGSFSEWGPEITHQ